MQRKMKVVVVFGGKSGEHEVSIVSAFSVARALDKAKYDVTMVGIDKTGRWVLPSAGLLAEYADKPREMPLDKVSETITLLPFQQSPQFRSLVTNQGFDADVILPILHGTNGEDGTIQGLFELAAIPYVGSGVLGSAVGMDKDVAKRLFRAAGIPVVPWKVLRKHEFVQSHTFLLAQIEREFGYPFFVKPANMGSSVGVHKVKSKEEAMQKIDDAFCYDTKLLVEKFIPAREMEVSVRGNEDPSASVVGEIIPHHDFYSYEAKYLDENGAGLQIPAKDITLWHEQQMQEMAIRAYQAIECRGLSRVDFFVDKQTSEIYLNEINTLPGFTSISMYPKLWAASGLPYAQLLDELISLALEYSASKKALKTSFDGASSR